MKKKLEIKFLFVNFLTFFRLISASIIALFLYFFNKTNIFYLFYSSFAVFILASISDFFDGFLARKWKIVSEFGQIFDPITDKILTTTTFFFLAYLLLVPWFFVLIFILRDIIVDGLRIFLAKKSVIIAANFWGKLKTVLQIMAISIIFLGYSISVQIYQSYYYLFNLGIIFSAFISLISGLFYIRAIAKLVKGKISN